MPFEPGNTLGSRFQPGVSGNPAGLPKGFKSFKTTIRELAEKTVNYKDLDNKKIQVAAGEALIIALMGKAIYKQDTQAAKLLMEHVEGVSFNVNNQETDEELDARIFELINKGGKDRVKTTTGKEKSPRGKEQSS